MKSISLAAVAVLGVALLAVSAGCGDDDAGPTPSPSPRPTATVVPAAGYLAIPDPQELYIASAAGAEMRFRSSEYISYSWGPSGTIAVISNRSSEPQVASLLLIQPDGTVETVAEIDGYVYGDPLWSPDGDRLLFFADRANRFRIISVALANGEVKELSDEGPRAPSLLAWPSTNEVLFVRQTDDGGSLLMMDPATGKTRQVTDTDVETDTYLSEPPLSNDQTKLLAGGSDTPGKCQGSGLGDAVYIIELATGDAKKVAQAESCSVASVAWSPDEAAIAYAVFEQPAASGAFVADLSSGQSHRISSDLDSNLRWLDDNTLIADRLVCWQCGGGIEALMLLRADGSGEEKLLEGSAAHSVSASGDRMAVADAQGVRITELDGSASDSVAEAELRWDYGRVSWAADDSHFAYVRSHGSNTNRVFEVDTDGQNLETLVTAGGGLGSYAVQQYPSPDGLRLAIVRSDPPEVEKAGRLWLADGDGSDEQQVDVTSVGPVAWSPDGTKLAATAEWKAPDGLSDVGLYIVNADGSDLINLKVGLNDWAPAPVWSPDGNNIAIPEYDRLWLVDTSRPHATEVDMAPIGGAGGISWAGNSQTLAVVGGSNPTPGSAVALVDADGTNFRVVPQTNQSISSLGLSPDGSKIAYWSSSGGNSAELFMADIDKVTGTKIATAYPTYPTAKISWSPDGTRFATAMTLPDGPGIYIVDVDDLEMRQVTDGGNVTDLWWVSEDRLGFTTEIGGL